MAHNPHAPQGSEGQQDPAGSTQMFRAFVEEEGPQRQNAPQAVQGGGPRIGLIVGVVAAVVIIAGAAWLALA